MTGRMNRKKPLRSDGVGNDNSFVKGTKRQRASLAGNLYSTVIVRVGQQLTEYPFFLVSLLSHSTYFKRRTEAMFNEGDDPKFPLVIDLPDFPYSLDVFKIIQDFCSNSVGMEDDDISIRNAVELFCASHFLEMDTLTCKVLNFLKEKVFNSFDSCLSLLATFDCNDLHDLDGEDSLFERCKKAILCKIGVNLSMPKRRAVGYNVDYLLRISSELSQSVADRIYRSFGVQLSNFDFVVFFEKPVYSEVSIGKDVICSVFFVHLVAKDSPDHHQSPGDLINGINGLKRWIPTEGSELWRPYELSFEVDSHLDKLMMLERCIKNFANGTSSSELQTLQWSFVCGQLIHSSEIYWYDVFEDISRRKEISSQETVELLKLLDSDAVEFSKHNLKKLFEELHIDCGPPYFKRLLEMQREEQIVKKKYSLEVLNLRTELRQAKTDKQMLEVNLDKSIQESQKMELAKLSERAETDKQVANLQGRLNVKTEELISVIETKRLIEADRDSLSELKRLAESERDALNECKKVVESKQEKLLRDLEEEKEKTTCQICLARPRDSLCLPCGHFLYCSECLTEHHKRTKTCPTCRCPASLALRCYLWV